MTDVHPRLNPAQHASVEITLREMEIALRQLLDEMDSHSEGILYAQTTTLTDEQRQRIVELTGAMLDEIAGLAETLGLSKQHRDPIALVVGQINVLWSDLVDIRADKLTRYGDVSAEAARTLDPSIDRMIRLTEGLIAALSTSAKS